MDDKLIPKVRTPECVTRILKLIPKVRTPECVTRTLKLIPKVSIVSKYSK